MKTVHPKANEVDIMLLLEGTYPYVTGGVSTWVYNLINNFSQYKFGIIFIGGSKDDYDEIKYHIPDNVAHIETHYIFDEVKKDKYKKPHTNPQNFNELCAIHQKFDNLDIENFHEIGNELKKLMLNTKTIDRRDFLYSKLSWDYIQEKYNDKCPQISFLEYFWTIRNMHLPLWKIIEIAKKIPSAKIFHSVSTGYAGLLGSILHHEKKQPFILTEHGIYVRERKIDLLKNQWKIIGHHLEKRDAESTEYTTNLWIDFFDIIARLAYAAADPIISLFNGYNGKQIECGAPKEKTLIISNGVSILRDDEITKHEPSSSPIIAMVGRIVSIKDLKTLIRSIIIVKKSIPDIKVWLVGPTTEEPDYVTECEELIHVLDLTNHFEFLGVQNIADILKKIDLLVLSSLSEGQPLAILDAFSAGVPVVTTDVGGCKELIYGSNAEDEKLGSSGIIVEIANANEFAKAIITMLQDKAKWKSAQKVGRTRVKKYYDETNVMHRYQHLYEEALK